MLTVYRSNRVELLARLLATQLRLAPPPPFQQVEVVVNTWPTSRWLGEQLAIHLGGVVAHVRFPFPGSHLRRLVARLQEENTDLPSTAYPAEVLDDDPWRATRLVWPLLLQLPAVAARPEGAPLQQWLQDRQAVSDDRLELGSWQLGRAIADAFDDYSLYRPDLLQAWEAGQDTDGHGRPLHGAQRWQPVLYRALREQLARPPFAIRVRQLIARLREGSPLRCPLQGPLRLFGLSSLAPVQVELLQALSGRIPVEIYLLTPCPDLWQRCSDRRSRLSDALALAQPLDADWILEGEGLEARFGRLGAEFQQLLEGTGEALLGPADDRDLFFSPIAASRGSPPSLLAQIQDQLADPSGRNPLTRTPEDRSLEFHPCPGRLRQVQIVRDRLLQLLAADPSLEPRQILIMTPDVERFAPLVASVFGDSDATGVALPWRLTDRSQQSDAGIGRTLLHLLQLAGRRLTASGLDVLLGSVPLQRHFGLDPEDGPALSRELQRCGFRWGLDADERGGTATHGLSWAIDRLLLGLVLPDRPGLAPGETAPWPASGNLERSGRWLHLLSRLQHWLQELRRPCPAADWGPRLRRLLDDLFGDGGDAAWELPPLLAAIDDWQRTASGCALQLEADVVAAVLDEALASESGRFGHRSGMLTISALEPMRAIPHRVIVLMGLDADHFPRQRQRPAFHLMERQRRLGDPSPRDQDRYVLLEALLSARDHLLISWSSREERTGEALQPCGPIQQWQQWLHSRLGPTAAGLTVSHAANPLDPSNFMARDGCPPASCDRRLLEALRRMDGVESPPPSALFRQAMPQALAAPPGEIEPFEDLREWLMEPQKRWLRQLGLRPAEWGQPIEDLEPLELEEWNRAALLRPLADPREPAPGTPAEWLWRCRGRGQLPGGAAGELEAGILQGRWSTLHSTLEGLGDARQEPLALGPWQASPLICGETVVVIRIGREDVPHRMDLWVQLLLACAAGDGAAGSPRQGVLIARDSRHGDRFSPACRLTAPEPREACAELERLASLRQEWQRVCWPIPPRTGWTSLVEDRRSPGRGRSKATETWEGGWNHRGEREEPTMALCFGADLPAAELFDSDFAPLASSLYDSLLEAGE